MNSHIEGSNCIFQRITTGITLIKYGYIIIFHVAFQNIAKPWLNLEKELNLKKGKVHYLKD